MVWTMSELGKQGAMLDEGRLLFVLDSLRKRFGSNESVLCLAISCEILDFFFGRDWTNENIHRPHEIVPRKHRAGRLFLGTDKVQEVEQIRYQMRITQLAEICFNLRQVDGFSDRIANLKTGNLESAFGELQCSSLFSKPELQFRFIAESGVKRRDYEGEYITKDGQKVCCEMKTKLSDTPLGIETITNSLKKAQKQLPDNAPGVVSLSIPELWVKDVEIKKVIESAVSEGFKSQRVVAVVLVWQEFLKIEGDYHLLSKTRNLLNEKSRLLNNGVSSSLDCLGIRNNPKWLHLQKYVSSYISLISKLSTQMPQ